MRAGPQRATLVQPRCRKAWRVGDRARPLEPQLGAQPRRTCLEVAAAQRQEPTQRAVVAVRRRLCRLDTECLSCTVAVRAEADASKPAPPRRPSAGRARRKASLLRARLLREVRDRQAGGSKRTEPRSGASSRASSRALVDLPTPFGPTSPIRAPRTDVERRSVENDLRSVVPGDADELCAHALDLLTGTTAATPRGVRCTAMGGRSVRHGRAPERASKRYPSKPPRATSGRIRAGASRAAQRESTASSAGVRLDVQVLPHTGQRPAQSARQRIWSGRLNAT